MNLLIVGCSRRKLDTLTPVPALDLYQGSCVPLLRARLAGDPERRGAVLVLSALHGLIPADLPLMPYDQPLTAERAALVRPQVTVALMTRLAAYAPDEVLLLLEPGYVDLVGSALAGRTPAVVHWIAQPERDWPQVAAILDRWGWP